MTNPFVPPRGITVQLPYRSLVLRADPEFEYKNRHQLFYEFSNGKEFREDENLHGAYLSTNSTIGPISVALGGLHATGHAGLVSQMAPHLLGVGGVGASTHVTGIGTEDDVPLRGLSAAGSAGAVTVIADSGTSTFFFALNLSGPENQYPVFPSLDELTWWKNRGVTHFRQPFGWSQSNPTFGTVGIQPSVDGPLDTSSTYLPLTGANQLYQSEDLTASVWTADDGAVISANAGITPPPGISSASSITDVASSSTVFSVHQSINANLGNVISAYFHAGSKNFGVIQVNLSSGLGFIASATYFNLSTGTVGSTAILAGSVAPVDSPTITSIGNGWYRCSVTMSQVNVSGATLYLSSANSDGGRTYTGTGAVAVYITGVQLNVGPTLLPYQAVSGGYVQSLDQLFDNADALGINIILDCHMFGSGPGGFEVGSTEVPISALIDMWTKVLTRYAPRPSFFAAEPMNEPVNGFDSSVIQSWCQQFITMARSTPINFQGEIHLDGTNYTGVWNWVTGGGQPFNNSNFFTVTDPLNKTRFEGHCYFDYDSSGTSYAYNYQTTVAGAAPTGFNTSPTIGVTRLNNEFLPWVASHGVEAILGEFGISNDPIVNGGTNNFQAWLTVGDNFGDLAVSKNIPLGLWGGGPGFAPNVYPFCPTPYNVSNPTTPDWTSAGIQSVQMALINRYVSNPVPQLTAYALQSPVTVTPTANPQAPIVKTIVYATAGVATPPFTVIGGGTIPAGTVITPHAFLSDGVTPAGGTFTPASITLGANGYLYGTFTYTASVTNTILISTTNNQGFIDPPARAITTKVDAWSQTGLQPTPLYNMYRSYAPYAGPAFELRHPTNGTTELVSFTNGDNLDRLSIQSWAGRQDQIPVVARYDQSPLGSNIALNGAFLTLQNAAGYPEITYTGASGTFNAPISRSGALTILTRMNQTGGGGGDYLAMSFYTGPFEWTGSAFFLTNTSFIGGDVINGGDAQSIGTVDLGIDPGTYHEYEMSYQPGQSVGLSSYVDGTLHATGATTATVTESFTLTQSGTTATVTNLVGTITIGDVIVGAGVVTGTTFASQSSGPVGGNGVYTTSLAGTASNGACNGVSTNYPIYTGFDGQIVTFGYSTFGGGAWTGSDQALAVLPGVSLTSGQRATILSFETAHYSTPLPDILPPIFAGVTNQQVVSGSPIEPFSSVVLQDAAGTSVGATITLSGHAATLSGTGLSGSNPYTLAADTPANVTAKLQALAFNTTGSGGDVTNIALVATSSTALTGTSSPTVTIRAGTAPSVTGMVGPNVSMDQGAPALWQVSVSDDNPTPMVAASITVSGSAGSFQFIGPTGPTGSGPYTYAADTPANLTRWLNNLLWAPSVHTAGATTTFSLTVTNAVSLSTTVTNTITNVAPAAMPTPLTPVTSPAALINPTGTYRGMSLSGGEDVPPNYQIFGALYQWAAQQNFGTIRLPFLFSTLLQTGSSPNITTLYRNPNSGDVSNIQQCLEAARQYGQRIILDDHAEGAILCPFPTGTLDDQSVSPGGFTTIGDNIRVPASAFADYWQRMVTLFQNYNIIVGLQNEANGDNRWNAALARANATAATAAIRTVSGSILIQLPSSADVGDFDTTTWTGYSDTGPFMFDVHQYFDNAGGTQSTCTTTPVSAYFDGYVNWLRTNGYKSTVSEFAVGTDSSCLPTFGASVLSYFHANNDVLVGWNWWGGGNLGFGYPYYMGEESGGGNPPQYALLSPYLP